MVRPDGAPPLATVRSLAYFSPVIEEVLHSPISPGYFQYLRQKIQRLTAASRYLTTADENPKSSPCQHSPAAG